MTNHHVVKDASEILVRLSDRRELVAEVIGSDPRSDIALLKVDADDLPVLKMGNSGDLKVGEWVLAIGSPFGEDQGQSISKGVISSFRSEDDHRFIQSDVNIHPGCSGGPLINRDGRVIGVAIKAMLDPIGSGVGVNYFIPIEDALAALNIVSAEYEAP